MGKWKSKVLPPGQCVFHFRGIEVPGIETVYANDTTGHAKDGENAQRPEHNGWRFLNVTGRIGFGRPKENHKNEAEHIERREYGDGHADGEEAIFHRRIGMAQGLRQNSIFAEESA